MSRICSFQPIFDEYCTLLILGSCPSIRSLEKGQYYGHPQNRFWRVISALLGESLPVSYEERKAMLLRHRVALWDVAGSCEREGSLDSSVKNVQPNDIPGLLAKCPRITAVAFNGTLSTRLYSSHFPGIEGM
ncbi:MAG: DNA-deoxyinosine glycosylase, partial [Bacillota bacterium]|nr:DNA-deoxyinosine glycosylase [Bacillota bacterium]